MKNCARMRVLAAVTGPAAILSSATAAAAPFDFHGNTTSWDIDVYNKSQLTLKYVLDRSPTHNVRSTGIMAISRLKGNETQLPKSITSSAFPVRQLHSSAGPPTLTGASSRVIKWAEGVGRVSFFVRADPPGFMNGTHREASGRAQCSMGEMDANQPVEVTITG